MPFIMPPSPAVLLFSSAGPAASPRLPPLLFCARISSHGPGCLPPPNAWRTILYIAQRAAYLLGVRVPLPPVTFSPRRPYCRLNTAYLTCLWHCAYSTFLPPVLHIHLCHTVVSRAHGSCIAHDIYLSWTFLYFKCHEPPVAGRTTLTVTLPKVGSYNLVNSPRRWVVKGHLNNIYMPVDAVTQDRLAAYSAVDRTEGEDYGQPPVCLSTCLWVLNKCGIVRHY